MNTAQLTEEILIAASEAGHRLFRNNTGKLQNKAGQWIAYGVGPRNGGGSDLIGWCAGGKFAAIEIKVGRDKPTSDQLKWIDWVNAGGGRAGVARSIEDALKILSGL